MNKGSLRLHITKVPSRIGEEKYDLLAILGDASPEVLDSRKGIPLIVHFNMSTDLIIHAMNKNWKDALTSPMHTPWTVRIEGTWYRTTNAPLVEAVSNILTRMHSKSEIHTAIEKDIEHYGTKWLEASICGVSRKLVDTLLGKS